MTDAAQLPPEEEKAARVESYGGVPISEEELGRVWETEDPAASSPEPPD